MIYPGDEFSVYQTVAPFNADNGYKLAGAYENGTTVDAYGGGICQVSTTLYNAVIRAELEVTERSGHSMIVNYVDPSADAAIAGEYKDFKLKQYRSTDLYRKLCKWYDDFLYHLRTGNTSGKPKHFFCE